MNSLDCFKTDAKAETDGVWVGVPGSTSELLIARMWNPRMTNAFRVMLRARKEGDPDLDPDSDEVSTKLLARYVLLGWRNVVVNGQEVPYTPELGEKYLADPNYHEFKAYVRSAAIERERFLSKEAADARGK
jgi:hypothetical protein